MAVLATYVHEGTGTIDAAAATAMGYRQIGGAQPVFEDTAASASHVGTSHILFTQANGFSNLIGDPAGLAVAAAYIKFDTLPSANTLVMHIGTGAGTLARVQVTPTGELRLKDSGNITQATIAGAFTAGQWTRVELRANGDGTMQARAYAGDSTTAIGDTGSQVTAAGAVVEFWVGIVASPSGDVRVDDVVAADDWVVAPPPPADPVLREWTGAAWGDTFTVREWTGAAWGDTLTLYEHADIGPRFAADPGEGRLYIGNNDNATVGMSIAEFDGVVYGGSATPTARCKLVRLYNGTAMAVSTATRNALQAFADEGRLPLFSAKDGGLTAAQMGAGDADLTWQDTAAWLADTYTGQMWYSPVFHEPEDNFPVGDLSGNSAAEFRAAFRRAVNVHVTHRPLIADRIAFCVPWLMSWTFDPGSGRDYRDWHPNWDGTQWLHDGPFDVACSDGTTYMGSWVHMDAIDLYNPNVSMPDANSRNKSWADSIANFEAARVAAAQPPLLWSIAEHGFRTEPQTLDDNGVTATDICNDMAANAGADGLVGSCFWTNDEFAPDATNDPSGAKQDALLVLGQRPEVVTI